MKTKMGIQYIQLQNIKKIKICLLQATSKKDI